MGDHPNAAILRANAEKLEKGGGDMSEMFDGKITERWAFSDDTERINRFFAGT